MVNKHKAVLLAWAEIVDNYITAVLLGIIKNNFELASSKAQLDFYLSTYEEDYSKVPSQRIFWYLQKQLAHVVKKKILPITPDLRLFELEFTGDTHLLIRTINRDSALIKTVKYQEMIDVDKTVGELNELLKPLLLKVVPTEGFITAKKTRNFAIVIDTPDAEIIRRVHKIKIID